MMTKTIDLLSYLYLPVESSDEEDGADHKQEHDGMRYPRALLTWVTPRHGQGGMVRVIHCGWLLWEHNGGYGP